MSHTEDTSFDEEGSSRLPHQRRDETLLDYVGIAEDNLGLFGDDTRPNHRLNSVYDITAPSEGVYNFDYPLRLPTIRYSIRGAKRGRGRHLMGTHLQD